MLAVAALAAEDVRLVPVFRHGSISGTSAANVATGDIDGDGRLDMVSCSAGAPFSVSRRGGTYETTWFGPAADCRGVAVGDRNGDGSVEVATISWSGPPFMLRIFDTRSLGTTTSVALPEQPWGLAMGNLDADPALEIAVVSSYATWVYDGLTLALQWTATGYGGDSVQLGDVDGDSRLELVLNGSTATVLDVATQTQKWGYVGGFGERWTLGNVDADPKAEIVYRNSSAQKISILNGDTFTSSTIPYTANYYLDGLLVADGDGDGTVEIIAAESEVQGLSPVDGTVRWSVPAGSYGDTRTMAVANVDDDAAPELIWVGLHHYPIQPLTVADAASGTIDFRSVSLGGPLTIATGDLDGDGIMEYVVAASSAPAGQPLVQIFDSATGLPEGELSRSGLYQYGGIQVYGIGQTDADPALEIVGSSDGQIVTWDAATKQVEFKSNTSVEPFDVVVANIDGDPVSEIVVSSAEYGLMVLDGASNIIQKQLGVPGGSRGLALADLAGDSKPEVVFAANHTVYVYETTNWTVLGERILEYAWDVAASPAGGGTVAASGRYGNMFATRGAALTGGWECEIDFGAEFESDLAIATVAGTDYVVAAVRDQAAALRVYEVDTADCPDPVAGMPASNGIHDLEIYDATGDGRDDLIISRSWMAEVMLFGLGSETRGDVDGDGLITPDDVDAAADYLFGAAPGASPSADTNADERIGVEDLFILIDHEFAGGAEPQP